MSCPLNHPKNATADTVVGESEEPSSSSPIVDELVKIRLLLEGLFRHPSDRTSASPWLTTEQAARYLSIAPASVRSLIARGLLVPDGKVGRSSAFRAETLDAFVTARASARPSASPVASSPPPPRSPSTPPSARSSNRRMRELIDAHGEAVTHSTGRPAKTRGRGRASSRIPTELASTSPRNATGRGRKA